PYLSFHLPAAHRALHSFPTRRSSDLVLVLACAALVGAFLALLLRSSGDSAALQVRGGRVTLVAVAKRRTLPHLGGTALTPPPARSEEHTSELQSRFDLVCRLLLEKKK